MDVANTIRKKCVRQLDGFISVGAFYKKHQLIKLKFTNSKNAQLFIYKFLNSKFAKCAKHTGNKKFWKLCFAHP